MTTDETAVALRVLDGAIQRLTDLKKAMETETARAAVRGSIAVLEMYKTTFYRDTADQ
jgi:hypothetical protein